jgi:hypothetical protein
LSYVYEVDAVEMPGLDSPIVPESEPEVLAAAGTAESLDDEVLPYEARPAVAAGRIKPAVSKGTAKRPQKGSVSDRAASLSKPPQGDPRLPGME